MNRVLGRSSILLAALLAATVGGPMLGTAPAHAASSYSAPLRTAIESLTVATEVRTGYKRSLFPLWIDADGDGCNTRYEVLIAEATTAPSVGSGCSLSGGQWYSYYDDASYRLPSDLDIDHVVPLAEAWDSGARDWTTSRRRSYANDLDDDRPLIAVKDSVNQAKGDRDPAQWMPANTAGTCRYIGDWVAIKIRWRLTVDAAEKSALSGYAGSCDNGTITVGYAF
jgi:hypothetical protein